MPADAHALPTALIAARFFGGNLTIGRRYMEQHWGQNRLDKSGFTRRLHALTATLPALFAACAQVLKDLHTDARYVIDSFPLAVCQNIRIPRCTLLTGEAGGQQFTARKANSKRPRSPAQRLLLQHFGKSVETTFRQLTARFPKHLHAVTAVGFVLKVALFAFVHTLGQAGY